VSSYWKIKKLVYRIVEQDDNSFWSKAFDVFISLLILTNVTALILETVPSFEKEYGTYLVNFEFYSILVFTVEYVLRIWVSNEDRRYNSSIKGRLKYIVSFSAIIDFLAFAPYYFIGGNAFDGRVLRIIRVFRIIRIFKLNRYSKSANFVGDVLYNRRVELSISIGIILILLLISSSFMYFAENKAQPVAFESIPAAMWWGITTLTTVGYGDVVPITVLGKVIGGFISILGVGLFALPAGILANGFNEELKNKEDFHPKAHVNNKNKCPHCGKDL
jgi:voltage-gated potassium channel